MPRMSDAKNRGTRGASGMRGQSHTSYHCCCHVVQTGRVREEAMGCTQSNCPNMLSHMEVLFGVSLIREPPVCHHDTVNTVCKNLFPLPLQRCKEVLALHRVCPHINSYVGGKDGNLHTCQTLSYVEV